MCIVFSKKKNPTGNKLTMVGLQSDVPGEQKFQGHFKTS